MSAKEPNPLPGDGRINRLLRMVLGILSLLLFIFGAALLPDAFQSEKGTGLLFIGIVWAGGGFLAAIACAVNR